MADNEQHSPQEQESVEPVMTRVEVLQEEYTSNALIALVPGIAIILLGGVMFFYQRSQGGTLVALSLVLVVIGLAICGYGITQARKARKVIGYAVECPFCQARNELTLKPKEDFRCGTCNREVPVDVDGTIMAVFQVRCGYCNTLNFYSEKSTGLICEDCDREIPIASDQETTAKRVFESYTIHDDNHPYDLVLIEAPESEDMIKCLQTMLALNRNQVKDILEELPQTLLQGIPKKKAELLSAQLAVHKGKSDYKISE